MGYIIKVKSGRRVLYGKRTYKTLSGARRSIKSPSGRSFIRRNKLTQVRPVKQRKMKI